MKLLLLLIISTFLLSCGSLNKVSLSPYEKMNFGFDGCNIEWGPLQKKVSEADMIKRAKGAEAKGFTYHPDLKYGRVLLGNYPDGCQSPTNMSWPLYLLKESR